MSRIGKIPVTISPNVTIKLGDNNTITCVGPMGTLAWVLPLEVIASITDGKLVLSRKDDTRRVKALHGLSRSLVSNMVKGCEVGFKKQMEIHGVGFRATVKGNTLNLALGYSHPLDFSIPEGIKITVTENTKLAVEGANKQVVGQVCADIRAYYPPEPYKGKGIRFVGETILRKAGKSVK